MIDLRGSSSKLLESIFFNFDWRFQYRNFRNWSFNIKRIWLWFSLRNLLRIVQCMLLATLLKRLVIDFSWSLKWFLRYLPCSDYIRSLSVSLADLWLIGFRGDHSSTGQHFSGCVSMVIMHLFRRLDHRFLKLLESLRWQITLSVPVFFGFNWRLFLEIGS